MFSILPRLLSSLFPLSPITQLSCPSLTYAFISPLHPLRQGREGGNWCGRGRGRGGGVRKCVAETKKKCMNK